ncbi:Uma2 family endonuclease [Scytonema millei]|uniref:Uma2 family endonuclease n=1 Tax=Scytonema millei VB511283 TaxID=1245923 RepID=A0A9X5E1N0_9CYAN|nr:Uma2 family endonuclease [Scytonema millei]NHC33725.1 Uma2 family endonuclease [Scytonema millei VB511283]
MLLQLSQIDVQPGQKVTLRNISWDDFEQILAELGDRRASRIAYYQGMLEIMVPLAGHESGKENIGDLVKVLLEELDIEFASLGSTTFKRQVINAGVEPDACFYIQNEAVIRGKERIDLNFDPPPDLAIEIDFTSNSEIKKNSYAALGVPELWVYNGRSLNLYVLQERQYVATEQSQVFPNLPIVEAIPRYVDRSKVEGRNVAIKAFRRWVAEYLGTKGDN